MKKIFLAVGTILAAATISFAQSNNDAKQVTQLKKEIRKEHRVENRNEVSLSTRNQFAVDFSDAKNVRFVKTKEFDEVLFLSGKRKLRAYYDYDSELVGTTQKKAFADLPANAQEDILKKYAGYNVDGVIKFDDNESNETDMIMYGTTFDDADNYFVELKNNSKAIILEVDLSGNVSFFKDIK